MTRITIDCEANGKLDTASKLLVLCVLNEDGTVDSYSGDEHNSIDAGLQVIEQADEICGHGIIAYDFPLIKSLYPHAKISGVINDTLVMARIAFPGIKDNDWRRFSEEPEFMPKKLVGSHSLKAWGHRLGVQKDTFGDDFEDEDWETLEYSPALAEYCAQDCRSTAALFDYLLKQDIPDAALALEQQFAGTLVLQEQHGFLFDQVKADALVNRLTADRAGLSDELQAAFPPLVETYLTPKKQIKKERTVVFNPSSRVQIAERFKSMGWEPELFTPDGRPRIDEAVLSAMPYPEAKVLLKSLLLDKRLGQLAHGKNALTKLVRRDSRIHGHVMHIGTVSSRCAHIRPNMAQLPSLSSEYGQEFRELFCVPAGYKLVGVDLKSAELRVLAGYLERYDGGKYIDTVLNSDVHQANADALEITRAQAKRAVYCWLYGGSARLLGEVVGGGAKEGAELQKRWYAKMPALKRFKEDVTAAAGRGYLRGIDHRKMPVRSKHSAVNLLLQSGASILCKYATVLLHRHMSTRLAYGIQWAMVAHVHDEIQMEVIENHAQDLAQAAVQAISNSAEAACFPCPMAGDYSIGDTWADTH